MAVTCRPPLSQLRACTRLRDGPARWRPCRCGGHRTRECRADLGGGGHLVIDPPPAEGCTESLGGSRSYVHASRVGRVCTSAAIRSRSSSIAVRCCSARPRPARSLPPPGCRAPCHVMRPAHTRARGRRVDLFAAAEVLLWTVGEWRLWAAADEATGGGDGCCSARCTPEAPVSGGVVR
jgi:hypothetical protein